MTPEMVQQMQGGQEMWSAGQIHEATKASDAKDLLATSAGEPIETTNEFQALETELLLKLFDFVFVLGIVILGQCSVCLHGRLALLDLNSCRFLISDCR